MIFAIQQEIFVNTWYASMSKKSEIIIYTQTIQNYCRATPGLEEHAELFADCQKNAVQYVIMHQFLLDLIHHFKRLSKSQLGELRDEIKSFAQLVLASSTRPGFQVNALYNQPFFVNLQEKMDEKNSFRV